MEMTRSSNVVSSCHKWQILTATSLKLIAVILMIMDHIHQMFAVAGAPIWLTMAGRLVFPIFLFAASESFYYTHSKRKYLQRLLFSSWGMTVFTFLLQRIVLNENVVLMNNAFSTFFVAGLYMLFWDWFLEGVKRKSTKKIVAAALGCLIPVVCALPIFFVGMLSFNDNISASAIQTLAAISLLVPNILTVEGGAALVVLGLMFYIFRQHRAIQIACLLGLSIVVYLLGDTVQCFMGLAAIPIALYNGNRGMAMKKFFYVFYPAHIGILYIVSALSI